MWRKCAGKCTSNDKGIEEKVSIFRFPSNEKEKERWVNAPPIKIAEVTNYTGVFEKHWPDGYTKTKRQERERPAGPPSVFKGIPILLAH